MTPATIPSVPGIGSATAGAAGDPITATATWTARWNGGAPIGGYYVTALRMSTTGTVLDQTQSDLQPATARRYEMPLATAGNYRFTVQAVNDVGASAQSARSSQVIAR